MANVARSTGPQPMAEDGVGTPPVASPCIQVCELDDLDVCTGCGRSLGEIAEWSQAANIRRQEICRMAQQRLATRNPQATHG